MPETLISAAKALVDAVSFDDSGAMVAGQWKGGNGGLLSRETLKAADTLRKVIAVEEAAREPHEAAS